MKQVLFVSLLILSIAMQTSAKSTGKNIELVKGVASAVKSAQASVVFNTGLYRTSSFLFNDKNVNAFYDAKKDELIGFSIPMPVADLPKETVQKIEARFGKYSFQNIILFVRQNGYSEFYVSMARMQKPTIVVSVNPNGKVHYFGKV